MVSVPASACCWLNGDAEGPPLKGSGRLGTVRFKVPEIKNRISKTNNTNLNYYDCFHF